MGSQMKPPSDEDMCKIVAIVEKISVPIFFGGDSFFFHTSEQIIQHICKDPRFDPDAADELLHWLCKTDGSLSAGIRYSNEYWLFQGFRGHETRIPISGPEKRTAICNLAKVILIGGE